MNMSMHNHFLGGEPASLPRPRTRRRAPRPPQVDDAIGEMLALQYEELLDSQAVLERRLQATVDGMADGQRQAAALVAEAAAKADQERSLPSGEPPAHDRTGDPPVRPAS